MFKRLAFISLIGMMFTSCGFLKSYTANYDVTLASVESPADAKTQFGETKVVTFQEGNINKYRYEDDYIDIVWFVGSTEFNFKLTNKSNHTIKLNWDDISYVSHAVQVSPTYFCRLTMFISHQESMAVGTSVYLSQVFTARKKNLQ